MPSRVGARLAQSWAGGQYKKTLFFPSEYSAIQRERVKCKLIYKSEFYKNNPSPINSFLPGSLRREKKKISVNLIN